MNELQDEAGAPATPPPIGYTWSDHHRRVVLRGGVQHVDRFTRIVLGYHGCDHKFADSLIRGKSQIGGWQPSTNAYDWLGHGIYFWEYAPERARSWAGKGGVIGAIIQLGTCLDLTDVRYTMLLAEAFESLRGLYTRKGRRIPQNRGKRRDLDCAVINELVASAEAAKSEDRVSFQTVRCPFLEGDPAFDGSAILKESHIQISVRDPACILGVFRPNVT